MHGGAFLCGRLLLVSQARTACIRVAQDTDLLELTESDIFNRLPAISARVCQLHGSP